jgi:hypothetical protein
VRRRAGGNEAGRGGGQGARCERATRERSYGRWGSGWSGRAGRRGGSRGGGGVGVDRLVACLGRTHGWLVQVMDIWVHHPR